MSQTVSEFIEHHGVKGMKWGVRKSGSRVTKGKTERRKKVGTARTRYQKSPKKLTQAELANRIKRMETEKRYNELNKRDVGKGKQIAVDILTNIGKNTAISVGTKVASGVSLYAIKKGLEKQLGKEIASEIISKKKKG